VSSVVTTLIIVITLTATMSLPWRFATVDQYVNGTIARLKACKHLNIGRYFLSKDELTPQHLEKILEAAMKSDQLEELTLCGICLRREDHNPTAGAALSRLMELLQSRSWNRVTFRSCGGDVLSSAFDSDQVITEAIRLTTVQGLTEQDTMALKRNLTTNPILKRLVLTEVDFSSSGTILHPLAEGIAASRSLETLEINYCVIHDDAIDILSSHGLAKNQSLVSLQFPGCELEDDAVRVVVEGISHHPRLKNLKLFRNHCGEGGVKALGRLLQSSTPSSKDVATKRLTQLEMLDLSYQQFERSGKLNVELLARSLEQNTTLKNLILSFNKLHDADAARLAEGLKMHNNLVEIDLRANNIRDSGAVALAEKVVSRCPKLRKFCLYGNPLGERGSRSLLTAIKANTEVEIMNMDYGLPAYDKIHYYAFLNQVGRRVLKEDDFNPALWSIVIQRANHLSLDTRGVCTAADLIYPFIRESTVGRRCGAPGKVSL
jgi:hypothetical protein